MNLDNFSLTEEIYIDSNIFLYVILKNPIFLKSCKIFLTKIENGETKGVISPLVIDEIAYKIIIEVLRNKLNLTSNIKILQKLDKQPELLNLVKPELTAFMFIINSYKGLRIASIQSSSGIKSFEYIIHHNLLPRDAMHLAIIRYYHINHIATNDFQFNTIPHLKVWMP